MGFSLNSALVIHNCEVNCMSQGINALGLFNEKAEKLANCRFTRTVFGQKTGVEVRGERGKPVEVIRWGPDQEAIDAFVLTFRFFIQDNEKSSFRNMAKTYQNLPISDDIKARFAEARRILNEFLDSTPSTSYNIGGETLNHRRILEVFVYGGLAHANPKKKRTYDRWMKMSVVCELLITDFVVILAKVMRIIQYVATLNVEAIEEMEKK